jgi:hypothetical protein
MAKRLRHPEKQNQSRYSTDEGMQIDCSDWHCRNAAFPKTVTQQAASKVTAERRWQPKKQRSEIALTDEGTQIERSGT